MAGRFDWFVVLAAMRTGSNFLEANLNAAPGVVCHGEAFNPSFIGYPNTERLLGMTLAEREADPLALLARVRRGAEGQIWGFRYFPDHDPRVLEAILDDPACAKIMLTRNPLESYVSHKIAQATGQWKLTRASRRKHALARFDAAEFEAHLDRLEAFQTMVLRRLQAGAQTAFHIAHEDLGDLDMINGLLAWLGAPARLERLDTKLKRQNPEPLASKVENPAALPAALARIDRFDLSRVPNFEPRRGPAVPRHVLAARVPLMFQPVPGAPDDSVRAWLAALDGVDADALRTGLTRAELRLWLRQTRGHRAFTVLRHPLARAHHVFCRRILPADGAGTMPRVRTLLMREYGVALPVKGGAAAGTADRPGNAATGGVAPAAWSVEAHREAFAAFLRFVRASLAGQTAMGVRGAWSSQLNHVEGFCSFRPPDRVLREDELPEALPAMALELGLEAPPGPPAAEPEGAPFTLADIHEPALEAAARAAWPRDYEAFGFGDWRPPD